MSTTPTSKRRRVSHLTRELTALQKSQNERAADAQARSEIAANAAAQSPDNKLRKKQVRAAKLYQGGLLNGTGYA
jgi:hypothetical protein